MGIRPNILAALTVKSGHTYPTGAVSTDGSTWTYGQQPQAEVIAAAAPSGDLPVVFSDFKNGVYWVQGVASGLGALWVQNSNWGTWNTANIVPGSGLGGVTGMGDNAGVMTDLAAAALLNGFTILMIRSGEVSNYLTSAELNVLPSYSFENGFDWLGSGGTSTIYDSTGTRGNFTGGDSKLAFTSNSDGSAAVSSDGAAVTTQPADPQTGPPTNVAMVGPQGGITGLSPPWITVLAFYIPQPNADLQTMSTP